MTAGRPLTPAQEQMWAGQQVLADVPLYNMVLAFELFGPLDADRFERAFDRLVEATDALRTRFVVDDDGIPHREVMEAEPGHLQRVTAEPDRRWQDIVQSVTETVIPTDGWLFRSGLIEIGAEHRVWYLAQHHLITDGWGVRAVYERMVELYRSEADRDFPQFEQRPIATGRRRPPAMNVERPAPSIYGRIPDVAGSTRVDRVDVLLDPEIVERIDARIGQDAGPLAELRRFAVYATALVATLARVGSDDRLCVLMPVRNRRAQADRETPGMFIEIRGIDVEVDWSAPVSELEVRVTAATRETLLATDGTASPATHRSAPALLNVIGESFAPFADCSMRTHWFHSGHGDREQAVRLQVHDFDGNGSWRIQFELNRSVFDDAREQLFLRHFDRALRAVVLEPDTSVADIELLSASEAAALDLFNQTHAPPAPPLSSAIERHVESIPEQIAIVDGDLEVGYEALWSDAGRIAVGIERHGRAPYVGIHLDRSIDLLTTILATIRAGGTFIPVPTNTPEARLRRLAATGLFDLIVSRTWASEEVDSATPDELREEGAPRAHPQPEHAYVMFTSGSTGEPKAVGVTPSNIANYVGWAARTYGDGPISMPLFTSIGFDLTLTSMLVPLATGGTVVVFPTDDLSTVFDVFSSPRIDVVKLTPSHLRLLADEQLAASGVRSVILGGENLERSTAIRAHTAGMRVFNEYGPTEATIGCMVHRFDPELDTSPSVPLGRPAANTSIEIRDRMGRRAPVGTVGELWIGGRGVAAGYLGREDLTSDRFIDDGARWYRTGDLARWSAPGVLEFLGRADDQVKVRGHRVELGEVEAALVDHPAVISAAVKTTHDTEGATQLVGYFVGNVERGMLRRDLAEILPAALIPAHLVALDALPLNDNGKVDRSRLPAPSMPRSTGRSPSGPVESTLAEIWGDVLGRDALPADAGFLEEGGDSILAIRVASLARKQRLTVRPADLLLNATIADLAETATSASDVRVHGRIDSAPITPIQRWLLDLGPRATKGWAQAMTLDVGDLDPDTMIRAWNALIEHTPVLRTVLDADRLKVGPASGVEVGPPDEQDLGDRLDPHTGRMVAIGFDESRMLVVIHHLVVDAVSWESLIHRLEQALNAPDAGPVIEAERRTFLHWADTLDQWSVAGKFDDELPRWQRFFTRTPVRGQSVGFLETRLTGLPDLLDRHRAVAAPQEILLAALAQVIGGDVAVIDIESHGRPAAEDLDDSIGWFTTMAPVAIATDADPIATLRRTKDEMRAIPNLGVGYGVLAAKHSAPLGVGDAAFNYLGRTRPAVGGFEAAAPLRLIRPAGVGATHPITLDAWIDDDVLSLAWCFATSVDGAAIADRFTATLRSLAGDLDQTAALSPSDFPHANLDADELADLLAEFGE